MVSEYISSNKILFYGVTGFKNLVGGLNAIAKLYETDGITSGSRYLGYNGQIENCISTSSSTCCPTDALYTTDTNLVKTAVGNLIGYYVSSPNSSNVYWLAGRFWRNNSIMCGSVVNGSGNISVYYGSNYLADISVMKVEVGILYVL